MDMLYSRIFWGIFVILLGVTIVINAVFKLNLPFFRILFSFILIYLGIKILLGSFSLSGIHQRKGDDFSTVFGNSKVNTSQYGVKKEYHAVFGSQIIDLRDIDTFENDLNIEFNCIFGSQIVYLPANTKIRIKGSSAFGSAQFPDGSQITFGDHVFTDAGNNANEKITLFVESNVVFGSVKFLE